MNSAIVSTGERARRYDGHTWHARTEKLHNIDRRPLAGQGSHQLFYSAELEHPYCYCDFGTAVPGAETEASRHFSVQD